MHHHHPYIRWPCQGHHQEENKYKICIKHQCTSSLENAPCACVKHSRKLNTYSTNTDQKWSIQIVINKSVFFVVTCMYIKCFNVILYFAFKHLLSFFNLIVWMQACENITILK
jgi:hypothetical protein